MSEVQNGRGALFAGGLAALLASTCCLGPLVLVGVGVSGAWIRNLAVLEPYRPIFIAVALVALFFAWRRIFRSAADCKPGEVCAVPAVRGTYKLVFCVVAALVVVALAFPYVLPLFTKVFPMKKFVACFAFAAAAATALAGPQTVKLSVSGMTCAACPITVKKALTKVDGVSKAEVNYEKREAAVTFDDTKTSVQKLAKASADAGFPATVKK